MARAKVKTEMVEEATVDLDFMATEYLKLNKQKALIEARLKQIGEDIKDQVKVGTVIETAKGKLTVGTTVRAKMTSEYSAYTPELLTALPVAQRKMVEVTVPSKSSVELLVKSGKLDKELADAYLDASESVTLRCNHRK